MSRHYMELYVQNLLQKKDRCAPTVNEYLFYMWQKEINSHRHRATLFSSVRQSAERVVAGFDEAMSLAQVYRASRGIKSTACRDLAYLYNSSVDRVKRRQMEKDYLNFSA